MARLGHASATTVKEFVGVAEPRLRRALCAAFGRGGFGGHRGDDGFFWEHRERVLGKSALAAMHDPGSSACMHAELPALRVLISESLRCDFEAVHFWLSL